MVRFFSHQRISCVLLLQSHTCTQHMHVLQWAIFRKREQKIKMYRSIFCSYWLAFFARICFSACRQTLNGCACTYNDIYFWAEKKMKRRKKKKRRAKLFVFLSIHSWCFFFILFSWCFCCVRASKRASERARYCACYRLACSFRTRTVCVWIACRRRSVCI